MKKDLQWRKQKGNQLDAKLFRVKYYEPLETIAKIHLKS